MPERRGPNYRYDAQYLFRLSQRLESDGRFPPESRSYAMHLARDLALTLNALHDSEAQGEPEGLAEGPTPEDTSV